MQRGAVVAGSGIEGGRASKWKLPVLQVEKEELEQTRGWPRGSLGSKERERERTRREKVRQRKRREDQDSCR